MVVVAWQLWFYLEKLLAAPTKAFPVPPAAMAGIAAGTALCYLITFSIYASAINGDYWASNLDSASCGFADYPSPGAAGTINQFSAG